MSDVDDDLSASTQRFQAFAERQDRELRPWDMRAPGSKIALLAAVIVAAIVIVVIALVLAG